MKNAAHVFLFVVAFIVFYAGLGIGLQHDANLGTALWLAAGAITAANILWMVRTRK